MLQVVEQNVPSTGGLRLPFLDRLYFVGKCVFDWDLPVGILRYIAADRFAQRLCTGEVVALADPVERYELLWRQRGGDDFLRAGAHGQSSSQSGPDEYGLMPYRTPVAGQSGHSRTSDAIGRFGRTLIAADRGLARQVARHRVEHRTRRQGGARRC
jgi:hypothetical protein